MTRWRVAAVMLGAGMAFGQSGSQLGKYAADNRTQPAHVAGRVIFFGDSITENWAKNGLGAAFFQGKPYLDRGISGQTAGQMVLRFQQDVISLHPDVVVILAGTNDVAGNGGAITPEMTEDDLRTMVDVAKAHKVRPVLCSLLPVLDYPWHKGQQPVPKIQALNAWMKEYASEEGIQYVDYYSAMADEDGGMKPGLSLDGVHPSAAGYRVMGPIVEKAIRGR